MVSYWRGMQATGTALVNHTLVTSEVRVFIRSQDEFLCGARQSLEVRDRTL